MGLTGHTHSNEHTGQSCFRCHQTANRWSHGEVVVSPCQIVVSPPAGGTFASV